MYRYLSIFLLFLPTQFFGQKPITKAIIVEASCGQCQFKMKGSGCDLAIKYEGKTYFVDGTNIDNHGDAHADDGFCNKIRHAKVKGKFVKNRFSASYFKLMD